MLNEKGFMGRRKTTVLQDNQGTIRNIKWCMDMIAWSNERVNCHFDSWSISDKKYNRICIITKRVSKSTA